MNPPNSEKGTLHMKKEMESLGQKTRLIRKAEVIHRIGRSNSALYQMIAAGTFPAPIHPNGCRTSVWVESEIDRWITDRLAEAGKEVAA
jgi:prophage regulatory protein